MLVNCNVAKITLELIDMGIEVLRNKPTYDPAMSVSRYKMLSPLRARWMDIEVG